MTLQHLPTKKAEHPRAGTLCLLLLLLFTFAMLLRRADVTTACMREGLSLCARAIVPSLFPFLVLSELLAVSGAGELLGAPLERIFGGIFGVSRAGCCALFLGLLCGFPTGARCAILSYERGSMGRTECERVIACASIPSSAFLISTVGGSLWGDAKFGICLYISALLSALFCGILLHVLQKRKEKEPFEKLSFAPTNLHFEASMLPAAIKNATVSTLLICAYVIFFATLAGALALVLGRFAARNELHATLAALLELSGGVSAAAKLQPQWLSTLLTGVAVGWSGISVHCQMLSLCEDHSLSLRPYLLAKLMQAFLCPLLLFILT